MRRALAVLAVPALLAACATGPATPERVTLDRDLLTVSMSDGSTCLGPGGGDGWSGRLTGCPWDYAYTVAIDPRTNPLRFVLEEIFGEALVQPVAEVTITDATGRARLFQTPERIAD
ncbi:hypothetical protein [Roseicyclus persicicus]|uniref:Lipoprotein n=1 Tax=Roseicyclus persicicus TaxID=2650661 RepID=A0A7X6GW81_9RHOB|nr:hypothetical protein [Roseibacterium persicicum]NKX43458.1 hypothetical protein [Roseibacterium persicicum]